MNTSIKTWIVHGRMRDKVVPISECVHFCGFRYGCDQFNPYENYSIALARESSTEKARLQFIDFLRGYRPRDLGEALGVNLSRRYGLWQFPWDRHPVGDAKGVPGWVDDPDDAPDILTHFSERGILRFRIEEEFLWAEKIFYSIRRHGFQTRSADRSIEAREFIAKDGAARYLLVDGNHRVSALASLGEKKVLLRYFPRRSVRESEVISWPSVRAGIFTREDALLVFNAYFAGQTWRQTSAKPAPLLEVAFRPAE